MSILWRTVPVGLFVDRASTFHDRPAFCVHNRSKNFTKKQQDASETVSLASRTDCFPRILTIEDGLSDAVRQVSCVVPVICVNRRNPKGQNAAGEKQHTWVSSFQCPLLQ